MAFALPKLNALSLRSNERKQVLQLCLVPGIQIFRNDIDVYGLSLGLITTYDFYVDIYTLSTNAATWYRNNYGLSASLLNKSRNNYALNLSVYSSIQHNMGLGISGLCGISAMNYGLLIAPFNVIQCENRGVTAGVLNLAVSDYPLGIIGRKCRERGNFMQIGVVNIANHGWQFGLFNYNKNSILPYSILFNYSAPEAEKEKKADGDK